VREFDLRWLKTPVFERKKAGELWIHPPAFSLAMLFYGTADSIRENATMNSDQESALWRGFSFALPAVFRIHHKIRESDKTSKQTLPSTALETVSVIEFWSASWAI
jgi:hypothetical protein